MHITKLRKSFCCSKHLRYDIKVSQDKEMTKSMWFVKLAGILSLFAICLAKIATDKQ